MVFARLVCVQVRVGKRGESKSKRKLEERKQKGGTIERDEKEETGKQEKETTQTAKRIREGDNGTHRERVCVCDEKARRDEGAVVKESSRQRGDVPSDEKAGRRVRHQGVVQRVTRQRKKESGGAEVGVGFKVKRRRVKDER